MKILLSLWALSGTEGLRKRMPLERKFVGFEQCQNSNPLVLKNGELQCADKQCKLKCDDGYDVYGGTRTVKCKQHSKPGPEWPEPIIDWNKDIGACKTCSTNPIKTDSRFNIECSLSKKGNGRIHKCKVRCINNKNINFGSAKSRKKAVTKCMCTRNDKQNRCHWRMGSHYLDQADAPNRFSNWNCGEDNNQPTPPVTMTTISENVTSPTQPTTSQATTKSTHAHPVFTIPDDLICPAAAVDGSNRRQRLTDQDRIVGGQDVKPNSWPWIARLRIGSFLCGGTILNDNTVVTAAHCCWGFDENAEFVKAIIGDHSTTDDNDGQEVFKATSVNIHPEYDRNTLANDICIVKTENMNLSSNSLAAAACLPPDKQHPVHETRCWTAGWGKKGDGKVATILQEVDVEIIDDETCLKTDNKDHLLVDQMFCAGYLEGGKDACQGDSGGPLICAEDGKPVLYGVTSWGFGCAKENSPGVWTKITNYVEWIDEIV